MARSEAKLVVLPRWMSSVAVLSVAPQVPQLVKAVVQLDMRLVVYSSRRRFSSPLLLVVAEAQRTLDDAFWGTKLKTSLGILRALR